MEENKKRKQAVVQPTTPSKTEGPARVPLPPQPPPPPHVAGIFSSAPTASPSFRLLRPCPGIDLPSPSFLGIPAPFAVVSSSSGLLLVRSSSSTYHVINPFLHSPANRRQLPPTPRPHPPTTPAVLSVDSRDQSDPVFRVICAIDEPLRGAGRGYTFDTFSSRDDEWFSTLIDESPLLGFRRVIGGTGVSNGCGMAFWLTDTPPAVVRVTAEEEGDSAEVFSVPEEALDPAATLQLGRLSESCIGLVAATRTHVILYELELDKSWSVHGFLNVARSEKEAGELPGVLSVVCRWPQAQPEVTRFEGDVTMRVNGRMVVWEIGCGNQSTAIRRLPTMPDLIDDDGVPYVYTKMAAWDFLEAEMQVMREFDQKRKQTVIQDSSRDAKKQKLVVARLVSMGKNIAIQHPPPPKIKRPALVPLPPSASPTYTYDVDGFSYHPGLSTAGFFASAAARASPTFHFLRPYPNLNLPVPSFFDIPSPFSVLSSSAGLLLVRSASTYHVLNPFIHSPASHRPVPQPDTHTPTTPAILAVDTRNGDSAYYIICAVEEKMDERDRRCTFDIYSSSTGEWFSTLAESAVLLGTRQIIPSTGVSNRRGNAFWLTDAPQAVVKVTAVGGGHAHAYGELIQITLGMLRPWARLQLGRLSESCIGIIATTWTEVTLLRLERDNSLVRHGFLNVKIYENEAVNAPSALSVVSQEWPEVVRFERDVAMWIHGRMVVWDIDWEHRITRTERLHMMPWWTRRPESIRDGVPYVETKRTAGDFTAGC